MNGIPKRNTLVSNENAWTLKCATGVLAVATMAFSVHAQSITVPNGSFETPTPPPGFPATPQVDDWQKTPEAPGYNPANFGGLTWDQLSGVFPNTASGEPDHIDNVQGDQASYLFSLQGVGFTQELTQTFQAGMSYDLTVGILGGGGISDGDQFRIGFFFQDAGSMVPIMSTDVTYSQLAFPNATHLIDYGVSLPTVQGGDAWAGKNIGIELVAISGNGSGYWDLDNVRLTAVPEPSTLVLLSLGLSGGLLLARRNRRDRR